MSETMTTSEPSRSKGSRAAGLLVLIAALLLVPGPVCAGDEEITLVDGTVIEGRVIIETPDRIVVKTPTGKRTLKLDQVQSRTRLAPAAERFKAKAAAIKKGDADGWRSLAAWCRARRLKDEEMRCLRMLLEATPGDPAAQKRLAELEPPPEDQAKAAARAAVKRTLADTDVHLDFKRASVTTILAAVGAAAGVDIAIDKAGRADLKKRNIELRYKRDASALTVLEDLRKHAGIDYIVLDTGVVIGTRKSIRALRRSKGLAVKPKTRMTTKEARRLLASSKHTLKCTDKPLKLVIRYLKENTPLSYYFDAPKELLDAGTTFDLYEAPLGKLLKRVLEPHGLDFMLQGPLVHIAPREKIARLKGG